MQSADGMPACREAVVMYVGPDRVPICGACGHRLAHKGLWRCAYVGCGKWLRGRRDR